MRTKLVLRLFALALVFMMTFSVPALAASCILCGQESGNDAYLCAECMLELLEEKDVSGGLEIVEAVRNDDGSVTLRWLDGADNGPYTVYYELLERAPVPFGWTAAKNVQGNAFTLTQLVPGMSYVFTVEDAYGNRVECIYFAEKAGDGNEIGAKIRIHTKLRRGRMMKEAPLSASEIMLDNGREHGLYLKMAYSMLRKTRNYNFCLTVEAPNGFADVVFAGGITLNYGKSEVPAWGFVALDDYFSYLERYYGGVPTGKYLVTMHFDGQPACVDTFTVSE